MNNKHSSQMKDFLGAFRIILFLAIAFWAVKLAVAGINYIRFDMFKKANVQYLQSSIVPPKCEAEQESAVTQNEIGNESDREIITTNKNEPDN